MSKRKLFLTRIASSVLAATVAFSGMSWQAAAGAQTTYAAQEVITTDETTEFSWDNATVYFVLTDRFVNADKSNDHSYGRGLTQSGAEQVGLQGNAYYSNPGTFHGGDIPGLTQKIQEGYFDQLGVNAIWITAPYEQIHGFVSGNVNGDRGQAGDGGGFPYYSYHGYWTLDYTQMDANMGTAEQFAEFVDTAHQHGIRVVMDIVMNHVGYVTLKDADEYGFGGLNSGWQNYYYGDTNLLSGGGPESQTWYDFNSNLWMNWWGPDFVRVGSPYKGYTYQTGGNETTMCLSGLPDVKTESTANAALPPLMKTKWTREGRYDQEVAELNAFFSKTGYASTPSNYIIKWLTDWVREYGVDGFRCDTAKHVDQASWSRLKTQAKLALKEWRAANPSAAGADWDDEFWMTGEVWGHGVVRSSYFDNGFDSLINFTFPRDGAAGSNLETTYSSYSKSINSDDSFNVLSYISSHDDGLGARGNLIGGGTALLLAPGAVQIYYGDESGRDFQWRDWFTSDYGDQIYRSDMNWNSVNQSILSHWQKVGQFRRNHIAVGAGEHKQISSSPYTFSRTYAKNGKTDKVVVAMPGKAGSCTVNCDGVFAAGAKVRDAYTGQMYTVSADGTVAVTAGTNGLVLLEKGDNSPDVGVSPASKTYYKSVNEGIELTLSVSKGADATYSINGGTAVPFTNGTKITIGKDAAFDTKTTVTVTASNADGTAGPTTYTYTKKDPSTGLIRVKAEAGQFASAPYAYIYNEDGPEVIRLTGAWPGQQMSLEDGYYVIEVMKTEAMEEPAAKVIFNGGSGSWQLPSGVGESGFAVTGSMIYEGGAWRSDEPDVPVDPESITLDKAADTVEIGSSITLNAAVLPAKADQSVTWTSSNPAVASVANGVVTGKAEGTATITAKTVNNLTATAKITVSKKVVKGTVKVNYTDTEGKVIKTVTMTGAEGAEYTTSDAEIEGYVLKSAPANAIGKYTSAEIVVTYVYEKQETVGVVTDKIYYETTGSTVTAYMYGGSSNNKWPGEAMTKEKDGLYSISVSDEYVGGNVIFISDGVQVPGVGQTGFQIIRGLVYNAGGAAHAYGQDAQAGTERTFFFTKPANWGTSINAYVYDADGAGGNVAAWPGKAMTQADGEYTLTVNVAGYTTPVVIFNDGSKQIPARGQRGFNLIQNGHYGEAGLAQVELPAGISIDSLTLSTAGPIEEGTKVKVSAAATGSDQLQYQFYYSVGGKETTAGAYSTAASAELAPTAGVCTVGVRVKDEKGNVVSKAKLLVVTEKKVVVTFPFTDVKRSDWFYFDVKQAYELGLMKGKTADTFEPNGQMNRAMVVTVLHRMAGYPKAAYQPMFTDVPSGQYFTSPVMWAAQNKVVNGYSDQTFRPMANVTREQLAAMLMNFAKAQGMSTSGRVDLTTYKDYKDVSSYAQTAMSWAVSNGIMSGTSAGELRPKREATRAEATKMLLNFYKMMQK